MEILHQFGFDVKLFLGQVVNFLVLFYLFKRFLFGPIQKILKEREERVKRGLEDAEKARLTLEESNREGAEILRSARIEAQQIVDNARTMAEQAKQDIAAQARAESERMVSQARAQAAMEMEKMEKNVRNMSVDLSQKILLNVIGSMFSAEEKANILQRALRQIESGPNKPS